MSGAVVVYSVVSLLRARGCRGTDSGWSLSSAVVVVCSVVSLSWGCRGTDSGWSLSGAVVVVYSVVVLSWGCRGRVVGWSSSIAVVVYSVVVLSWGSGVVGRTIGGGWWSVGRGSGGAGLTVLKMNGRVLKMNGR